MMSWTVWISVLSAAFTVRALFVSTLAFSSGASHARRAQALRMRLGSDQDPGLSTLGGSCVLDVLEIEPERPDGDVLSGEG